VRFPYLLGTVFVPNLIELQTMLIMSVAVASCSFAERFDVQDY
jgi:hypothetical protein